MVFLQLLRLGKPARHKIHDVITARAGTPQVEAPQKLQTTSLKKCPTSTNIRVSNNAEKSSDSGYLTIRSEITFIATIYPPRLHPAADSIVLQGVFIGSLPGTELDELYPGWVDQTKIAVRRRGVSIEVSQLTEGFWAILLRDLSSADCRIEHLISDIDALSETSSTKGYRGPKVKWMTLSQFSSFVMDLERLGTGARVSFFEYNSL
ncbi:hypothetical protein TWF706_000745 [Orbilia oligospora]|nr:hypothetical protein TWF706_000745 [Orbilia oligospora]